MNREPIKILADIIEDCFNKSITYPALTSDQIFIYNQDFKIPEDDRLYIILQYNNTENYSTTNRFIPADEGVEGAQENIAMLTKEDYTINVISKSDEARQRKEEVILSLNSNFSQDQQGLYQFQIARVSNSFVNLSELEGAGMVNRFAITVSVLAHYDKTMDTTYYDDFTNEIEVDPTI